MYNTLEKLMEQRGESAAELSRATGISEATIAMWKVRRNEKSNGTSAKNAILLANHFGVPVETFLSVSND